MQEKFRKHLERLASQEEDSVLPPVPDVLLKLLDMLNSVSANAETLEQVIEQDLALTAKILRVANSPYYGAGNVSSVSKAILLLGVNEIRRIAFAMSLHSSFTELIETETFTSRELWAHSFAVAYALTTLGRHADFTICSQGEKSEDTQDVLFVLGLLHDIGILVMGSVFKDEFGKMVLEIEKGRPLLEVEEETGLFHAEVGAFLIEQWNLCPGMAEVVRRHHDLEGIKSMSGVKGQAAGLLYTADNLVKKLEIGWTEGEVVSKFTVPANAGITRDELAAAAQDVVARRESLLAPMES